MSRQITFFCDVCRKPATSDLVAIKVQAADARKTDLPDEDDFVELCNQEMCTECLRKMFDGLNWDYNRCQKKWLKRDY